MPNRGGRPWLSDLMSFMVSVDVKQHQLNHALGIGHSLSLICQPADIRGHEALHHHHDLPCIYSVAGELCKLARVTGPEFPPPLLSSPTLPASDWPVPRGAV